MSVQLADSARTKLDDLLVKVKKERRLPALFLGVTSADDILYENEAGSMDYDDPSKGDVGPDTILYLASMTKFITSIAVHQLVDRGLATLDDSDLVVKHLPELGNLQIITGYDGDKPILKPVQRPPTLRMLLTHTAGFCYFFSSGPHMERWLKENRPDPMYDSTYDWFVQPLKFEPGTDYNYSISIDWAGFFVERVTGKNLEEYFQENIFKPCGMKNTTFLPSAEMQSRRMKLCNMDDNGKLSTSGLPDWVGKRSKPEDIKVFGGGGGLFGNSRDYLRFLQAVLRCSPDYSNPPTNPLISTKSFEECFKPSLQTDLAKEHLAEMMLDQSYHSVGRAKPTPQNVDHSPALALYLEDGNQQLGEGKGKLAGSGMWDGAFKTVMALDPKSGIAWVCNTQIASRGNDNAVGEHIKAFEVIVYEGLQK